MSTSSGLSFKHELGDTGRFYIVENTPSGCAFFDFNNGDYLDIFVVQSGSSVPLATVSKRPFSALYKNNGDGTFANITVGSGLDKNLGYAQGVAVGDYDNDGYPDLFITAYSGNHQMVSRMLARNQALPPKKRTGWRSHFSITTMMADKIFSLPTT